MQVAESSLLFLFMDALFDTRPSEDVIPSLFSLSLLLLGNVLGLS